MKPSGRYAEGERNRQTIIDFFVSNPGATIPELIACLMPKDRRMNEVDRQQFRATISGRVKKMSNMGEIRREKFNHPMVNCHGDPIRVATYKCWAMVEKTRSIEEVYATSSENVRRMDKAKGEIKSHKAKPEPKCEPWRTRSKDLRNPYTDQPLQNQGGQGALRREIGI